MATNRMKQISTEISIATERLKVVRVEMQTVIDEAKRRIAKEKQIAEERKKELAEVAKSNETLKNIAEAEIADIESRSYSTSEPERTTLNGLEREARNLISEIKKSVSLFADAKKLYLQEAAEEEREINRIEVVLLDRWIDSLVHDFDTIK